MTKKVPMNSIHAAKVAKHFVNTLVLKFGPPKKLVADSGEWLKSKFFQEICHKMFTKNNFTNWYHPQNESTGEKI